MIQTTVATTLGFPREQEAAMSAPYDCQKMRKLTLNLALIIAPIALLLSVLAVALAWTYRPAQPEPSNVEQTSTTGWPSMEDYHIVDGEKFFAKGKADVESWNTYVGLEETSPLSYICMAADPTAAGLA